MHPDQATRILLDTYLLPRTAYSCNFVPSRRHSAAMNLQRASLASVRPATLVRPQATRPVEQSSWPKLCSTAAAVALTMSLAGMFYKCTEGATLFGSTCAACPPPHAIWEPSPQFARHLTFDRSPSYARMTTRSQGAKQSLAAGP